MIRLLAVQRSTPLLKNSMRCMYGARFMVYNPQFHKESTRYWHSDKDILKAITDGWLPQQPNRVAISFKDKFAKNVVAMLGNIAEWYFGKRWSEHACYVEALAAVPGIVAGKIHTMHSLKNIEDCFWIKPLVDESENERMHLMAFKELAHLKSYEELILKTAHFTFRQIFSATYHLSPYTAHRMVGYIEEYAVYAYTKMYNDIKAGIIENVDAPQVAKDYWGLPDDAKYLDLVAVVRADEGDHRMVNHHLADEIVVAKEANERACKKFDVDYSYPLGDGVSQEAKQEYESKNKKEV